MREMLIQHILTEEIFSQVFDNPDFHHKNNVARELYALENTFFTGKMKYDTLAGLRHYYAAIKSAAALVPTHHEKQNFLKLIYENFYKVYDRKRPTGWSYLHANRNRTFHGRERRLALPKALQEIVD